MLDKIIEKNRYDNRSKKLINNNKIVFPDNIPSYLKIPNKYYYNLFKNYNKKSKVLEIGCGAGENTKHLIDMSFDVYATDISPSSIELISKRFYKCKNLTAEVADMEKLPFQNEIFDIVCSAGSLSYGNNDLVMLELFRVLKKNGTLIILDSLNENPIFRLNRYVNYLRGKRSKSTLYRVPNVYLIEKYIQKFGYGRVKFFGSITWAFPLLKILFSDIEISKISNWIDKKLKIKKSAFKFVLLLNKNNK
jgi:ubiquinone/menaquinone biosynthesis C-methylase UbiE